MNCPQCGAQLLPDTVFCHKCGTRIGPAQQVQPAGQPLAAPPPMGSGMPAQGRGGIILTLGILAIVLLGAITGIPAWVMGHRDLKEIRAGNIPQQEYGMTMAGMVLGIIGTAISAVVVMGIIVAIMIATLGIHRTLSSVVQALPGIVS